MSEAKRVMENYHKAREIVAKEVAEKYGLVETFRDHDTITLDSQSHSFHISFFIPDGRDLFATEKGKLPNHNFSFLAYVLKYSDQNLELTKINLKKIFKDMPKLNADNSDMIRLYKDSFLTEFQFLHNNFRYLFL